MFECFVFGQMYEIFGLQEGDDLIVFYIQVFVDKIGFLIVVVIQGGVIFFNVLLVYEELLCVYGEKIGVVFQLFDDVIDLLVKLEEIGKVLGIDLCVGVLIMFYLLLKVEGDVVLVDFVVCIDDGVVFIVDGVDLVIFDGFLDEFCDYVVMQKMFEFVYFWMCDVIDVFDFFLCGIVCEVLI